MARELTLNEVTEMVQEKLLRHPDLDWTCAAQSIAMQTGWNEQELLETLKSSDFDLAPDFQGESQ